MFSVPGFPHPFGMGYLVNPYAAYANGSQLVSKQNSVSVVLYRSEYTVSLSCVDIRNP